MPDSGLDRCWGMGKRAEDLQVVEVARLSRLEETLALHIRAEKLPDPEREYRFCKRRWRFDFAWPDHMLAVEVEGGVWTGGRHNRGKGFVADCQKYNAAALMGWKVLRFPGDLVTSGEAINTIQEALG